MAEERISVSEDISMETSKIEKQREKRLKKMEQNILELWNNYNRCSICIMGIPGGEEREKGTFKT